VKELLKSVYIYGSYRKIKTGLSLFWTTRYNHRRHVANENGILKKTVNNLIL